MPITCPSPETRCPTFSPRTEEPTSTISPAYSWPTIIGTGMVFCAHASQFQMWMSVPQMPVFATFTRISSGPISGTGSFSSHRPGSALAFTRAFMSLRT